MGRNSPMSYDFLAFRSITGRSHPAKQKNGSYDVLTTIECHNPRETASFAALETIFTRHQARFASFDERDWRSEDASTAKMSRLLRALREMIALKLHNSFERQDQSLDLVYEYDQIA